MTTWTLSSRVNEAIKASSIPRVLEANRVRIRALEQCKVRAEEQNQELRAEIEILKSKLGDQVALVAQMGKLLEDKDIQERKMSDDLRTTRKELKKRQNLLSQYEELLKEKETTLQGGFGVSTRNDGTTLPSFSGGSYARFPHSDSSTASPVASNIARQSTQQPMYNQGLTGGYYFVSNQMMNDPHTATANHQYQSKEVYNSPSYSYEGHQGPSTDFKNSYAGIGPRVRGPNSNSGKSTSSTPSGTSQTTDSNTFMYGRGHLNNFAYEKSYVTSGGFTFSRKRRIDDKASYHSIDGWENSQEDTTAEKPPLKVVKWDEVPSADDRDNEEYAGFLQETKVFTPSTQNQVAPPLGDTTNGCSNNVGIDYIFEPQSPPMGTVSYTNPSSPGEGANLLTTVQSSYSNSNQVQLSNTNQSLPPRHKQSLSKQQSEPQAPSPFQNQRTSQSSIVETLSPTIPTFMQPNTVVVYDKQQKKFLCETRGCDLDMSVPLNGIVDHLTIKHAKGNLFRCKIKRCQNTAGFNSYKHLRDHKRIQHKIFVPTSEKCKDHHISSITKYLQSLMPTPPTSTISPRRRRQVKPKGKIVDRGDPVHRKLMANYHSNEGKVFRAKWDKQSKSCFTLQNGQVKVVDGEKLVGKKTIAQTCTDYVIIMPNMAGEFTILAAKQIQVGLYKGSANATMRHSLYTSLCECGSNRESTRKGKEILPQFAVVLAVCTKGTAEIEGELVSVHNEIKFKVRNYLKEKPESESFSLRQIEEADDVDEEVTEEAFRSTIRRYKKLLKPELKKLGGRLKSRD